MKKNDIFVFGRFHFCGEGKEKTFLSKVSILFFLTDWRKFTMFDQLAFVACCCYLDMTSVVLKHLLSNVKLIGNVTEKNYSWNIKKNSESILGSTLVEVMKRFISTMFDVIYDLPFPSYPKQNILNLLWDWVWWEICNL